MIWKPKEKELTQEEAVALVIKELAPFWFGSLPELVAMKTGDKFKILPLNADFVKKDWLVFFIDPTIFSGETALMYAKEWFRRYNRHHVEILVVFTPTYEYLRNPETIQTLIERQQIGFPMVLDADEGITSAFNALVPPKVVLLHEGANYLEAEGQDWLKTTELDIQIFLRSTDPGLALLTVFQPSRGVVKEVARVEFGSRVRSKRPAFPPPEFLPQAEGIRAGKFSGKPIKLPQLEGLFLEGNWSQDAEKIIPLESNAVMGFISPGTRVSIFAQSLSKTPEIPAIGVEIEGLPAYELLGGEHITMMETGESLVRIERPQIYHIFVNLPVDQRKVTFRFSNAKTATVAIYGLRLGE